MENRLEHVIEGIVMDYTELYLSELEVLALFSYNNIYNIKYA